MTEKHAARLAGNDWAANLRGYALAWGLPSLAILAGAFLAAPGRAAIWSAALLWMGGACLVNARRCGRVHCRYTGPYYLLLIAPTALAGAGVLPLTAAGWWLLGGAILVGGKAIWWLSEARLGRYG